MTNLPQSREELINTGMALYSLGAMEALDTLKDDPDKSFEDITKQTEESVTKLIDAMYPRGENQI